MDAELYMRRCLELARKGEGLVAPNPMVGAVIVHKDKLIGEGYHQIFGGPHAEVNAINSVKDQKLLPDSTLFVSLEPCSHFGKTPPCANMIVEKGIRNVIIGSVDSNVLVAGQGINIMEKNGCVVERGILEQECRDLNSNYYTFHEKQRPYIILKWAQTLDGYIDRNRDESNQIGTNWITDDACRTLVHKWRSEVQAITVGTKTLLTDDPSLNCRDWPGKSPVRIVVDRKSRLPQSLKVFNTDARTYVFSPVIREDQDQLQYFRLSSDKAPLSELLEHLFRLNIQSLLVEGGTEFIDSFLKSGTWDEARVFTANIKFGTGLKSPSLSLPPSHAGSFSSSELEIFYNTDNY